MEATDFLSKILWDLSNLDESTMSPELNTKLFNIRGEIASYLGLDYQGDNEDDRDSCGHCGEYHSMSDGCLNDYDINYDQGHCGCSLGMDPNTECPTCS